MKRLIFFVAALLFLFMLFLPCEQEVRMEYKIGPKDLLEFSVFGLDEMNQTVRVSESGKITLPLLGEIEVEGLTKTELERKLGKLLEEYLKNPQVSVFIREYQSKRVSVLGAVGEPGHYELLGRLTLLQIIAQAGSLTPEAGDEIFILRQGENGDGKTLTIPVDELMLTGDSTLNIPLEPDDIINIPLDKTVTIYVHGRVNNPGAFEVKKSKLPTLQQAIAQAGGFAEGASKGRVILKRIEKNGEEIVMKVNVKNIIKGKNKDIQLKENDVIYVPEKIF